MAEHSQSTTTNSLGNVRVDLPHLKSRNSLEPAPSLPAAEMAQLAGLDPDAAVDQLEQQAMELGQRLRDQQRDLDRRESEFHAKVAKIECELRTARMICVEHELELRQRGLDQDLTQSPYSPSKKQEASKLDYRLDTAHEDTAPTSALQVGQIHSTQGEYSRKFQRKRTDWEARFQELEKSEQHLQAQIAQLAFDRKQLDDDRAALLKAKQKQESAAEQATSEARGRFEKELLRLQEWSQNLDRRSLTIEQLHRDATRMYREAIETRICNEQLWSQINARMSSTEATQTIAGLRRNLTDHFHLAEQRADEQKAEIAALIATLADHQSSLRQQRDELRQWIARRHAELEGDAEKLLARERELDHQDNHLSQLKSDWTREKNEYEQKIRRLSRMVSEHG